MHTFGCPGATRKGDEEQGKIPYKFFPITFAALPLLCIVFFFATLAAPEYIDEAVLDGLSRQQVVRKATQVSLSSAFPDSSVENSYIGRIDGNSAHLLKTETFVAMALKSLVNAVFGIALVLLCILCVFVFLLFIIETKIPKIRAAVQASQEE